jgi:hypothetical protein
MGRAGDGRGLAEAAPPRAPVMPLPAPYTSETTFLGHIYSGIETRSIMGKSLKKESLFQGRHAGAPFVAS